MKESNTENQLDVTFVLPSKSISGGTRVVFQHANNLAQRGHNVTIVYPTVPPYLMDLLRTVGPLSLAYKWFETRDFESDIEWEVNVDVCTVPLLSASVQRIWHNRIPDGDIVITASWRTAKAVKRLPPSKGAKCHLVQDYEVWDLWNSDDCWNQAQKIADEKSDVCLNMYNTNPTEKHIRRQKRQVDEALRLPLTKLVISPWIAVLLKQHLGQDVTDIIPNGTNTDVFYPDNQLPEGFTRKKEKVRIVAPYRTPKYKGVDTLFRAFEQVREQHDDTELYLYGSDADDLPSGVSHVGRIPDDELRRLYSNADLFVLPSHAEGWGLPSTEAAACRTAIISTDTGWVRDYVNDDTIRTVPPRDADSLAAAMSDLVNKPDQRREMAEKAYELVTSKFTKEQSTDHLEEALLSI